MNVLNHSSFHVSQAGDPLIAVASGLNVGEDNFSLELEILIDFLNGELGSLQVQAQGEAFCFPILYIVLRTKTAQRISPGSY